MTTANDITETMLGMRNEAQSRILMRFFKTGKGEYGEGDKFLGIRVPAVRAVAREAYGTVALGEVEKLLRSPWHEIRLCGFLLLVEEMRRALPTHRNVNGNAARRTEIARFYIAHAPCADNWDLVDLSCGGILGKWLLFPDENGGMPSREILDSLVQFLDKDNKPQFAWATSWGVSTRLMGALIMAHSDDNGLVLPPELAPTQVVIVPIFKNGEQEKFDQTLIPLKENLEKRGISVKYDNSDNKRPGFKFADYELRGVPVRLVMGGRDLANGTIELMRRDTLEKETVPFAGIEDRIADLLTEMQKNIFQKAKKYRDEHVYTCDNYEEFKERIKDGGFFLCPWDGTEETEAKIKEETQATIRCIPYGYSQENLGNDMVSGKPAVKRALIARAY